MLNYVNDDDDRGNIQSDSFLRSTWQPFDIIWIGQDTFAAIIALHFPVALLQAISFILIFECENIS